jgi:hypothetical protein
MFRCLHLHPALGRSLPVSAWFMLSVLAAVEQVAEAGEGLRLLLDAAVEEGAEANAPLRILMRGIYLLRLPTSALQ